MEYLSEFALDFEYRPGRLCPVPDALSRLNSVTVEPSWLARISRAQFQPADLEMARLVVRARSNDPNFRIRGAGDTALLYRVPNSGPEQLVLPSTGGFREIAMAELHDNALAGHFGANKTISALLQRVWWPGLAVTVREYVRSCPVCQRCKDRTTPAPGLLQPLPYPASRFSEYSMDFIFGLPSCHGFDGILTVVDRATKRVMLRPVAEMITADQTAGVLFDSVIRMFGVPAVLLSDRDPRFVSGIWQGLMRRLGTRLVYSSAHHPQTDGQTERAHRVIEQVLRSFVVSGAATDWVEVLGICEFAINSTVSASTGKSPNELTFGQNVRLPVDLALGVDPAVPVACLGARIGELFTEARTCVERAQLYQKTYFDKHHSELEFSVGDQVLLSTAHVQLPGSRKLRQRWIGPFAVLGRVGPTAYRLQLPAQYRMHPVIHVSQLRKYFAPGPARVSDPPAPIIVDGGPELEVERVLAHRYVGRQRSLQFRVLWRGYDVAEATWEPASHLANAPQCVQEYWDSVGGFSGNSISGLQ